MACELLACCQFFNDKMKNMPKAGDYIKKRLCFGDYASCNRYMIYKECGGENIPRDLDPDSEEVEKVIQCLRRKQLNNSNCEHAGEKQHDGKDSSL
jgi:hypothetical protein